MRLNVYTEELPDGSQMPMCEVVTAEYVSSRTGLLMKNYGLRVYLKSHPDLHYIPGRDDDRSAVTFWCGSKEKNLRQFVDILKQTVELNNLDEWREKTRERQDNAEKEIKENIAENIKALKND